MKVKGVISALLCSSMLMLSTMPASAAECSHTYWGATISEDEYKSLGEENHEIYYLKTRICYVCGKTEVERVTKGTERHSKETLADLGHISPKSHKYKIGCTKCGYSFEVIVPCADH